MGLEQKQIEGNNDDTNRAKEISVQTHRVETAMSATDGRHGGRIKGIDQRVDHHALAQASPVKRKKNQRHECELEDMQNNDQDRQLKHAGKRE